MSFIHKDWGRCWWTYRATSISCYVLCSVSLFTMTAISVDRLLAMLLRLRLYSFIFIASCSMITFASYSKIFRALRLHHTQIQDHAQQHPSQPNVLNIAPYRKAVYNTLWVQVALFVCYLPYCILVILITFSKISPTHLAVSAALTEVFISFNSNLKPFIYCWKISEVRQAVKQKMRQGLCCL